MLSGSEIVRKSVLEMASIVLYFILPVILLVLKGIHLLLFPICRLIISYLISDIFSVLSSPSLILLLSNSVRCRLPT